MALSDAIDMPFDAILAKKFQAAILGYSGNL
jgi:hypothetical protein